MVLVDDPYRILGLCPGANEREISRAYRRLAKLFHPDLNPNRPEVFVRFNEINWARDCLNSPARSRRADQDAQGGAFDDDAVVVMPI